MTTKPPLLAAGTPAAEVATDAGLVRALLAEQHPDLAELPVQELAAGWDNAMFRLGDRLVMRLPRRAAAADLIAHEQAWLPQLATRLPLPIPAPLRTGRPGCGYPWGWSVLPWLAGEAADEHPPADDQAARVGAFLRALHQPAPAGAPINPVRGCPLRDRAAATAVRIERLSQATTFITPGLLALWHAALDAPIDAAPGWLHGDLHARNILVENGRISGIIDWGDITAGDPATDLSVVWMLFGSAAVRQQALEAYGPVSAATLVRARGWALAFGLILLDSGMVDNPRNAALGAQTLRRALEHE